MLALAKSLVPANPAAEMVMAAGVDGLLAQIRPECQAKALIDRVKKILPVDPSSACQRLLNAAIHDLREKIIIAGLDVADQAASRYKHLPTVKKPEDVYELSASHTLDLAHYMGLLNRPDWRRLKRAYDIRKDLEHEDDQYEAGVEDCVYVFRTCIDIVLSKDPIAPIKVVNFKDMIESPRRVTPSSETVEEFAGAPDTRQVEICKFLVSVSRDDDRPDIVRQNSDALRAIRPVVKRAAQAKLGQHVQEMLKGRPIDLADAKISAAAGVTPYLRQARLREFFESFHQRMTQVGHSWHGYGAHGKLLDDFEDVGGLEFCPAEPRRRIVLWMVKCYIGQPGGYGMGVNRPVFYSNVGTPRVHEMFRQNAAVIREDVEYAAGDRYVRAAIQDKHIARRLEGLRDLISASAD